MLVKFLGENEFHERILTSQVQGHLWMALTPDEDHYPHHLVEDVSEIFLVGPRGGVPVKASRQGLLTYRFRNKYSVDMLDSVTVWPPRARQASLRSSALRVGETHRG